MDNIEVSMTELHHNLAKYIELARAGHVITVVNRLRNRVECHITAPTIAYDVSAATLNATDTVMDDEQ